ncbi:unnamed protein product [Ectocarpus sp. 4 AP-2014]
MFARAATKTTTLGAQQATQAQDTVLTRATSSHIFEATEARPSGIATLWSSQAASKTGRPRTSEGGKSTPETLEKARKMPHTARTRLNALGVSSTGTLDERVQQSTFTTKQPPENMGKHCPDTGRKRMNTSACAMVGMENEEERNGRGGDSCGDGVEHHTRAPKQTQPVRKALPGGAGGGAGATAVAGAVVGLTAEALARPAVVLDRSGRVKVVKKHLLAFDEVWPADLPALRPLRLNLRRSCGAGRANGDVGHSDDNARKGEGQSGGGRFGGPVFLMPMHRRGKGVQGREDKLFPEPPRLRRDEEEMTMNRNRYCLRDQGRCGEMAGGERSTGGEGSDSSGGRRKWTRCKIAGTGVDTWRWEWSPEAQMMLGKLALWTEALLVSRTQTVLTGEDEKSTPSQLSGLGMAGRVVVEGAAYPRCLLIEAYIPASSETIQLYVSVDELERLFRDDPEKTRVGRREDMVLELVKMLYFDYTLETEEADATLPGGIRFTSYHYSDREPWTCLHARRDSDFDLHWESRNSSAGIGLPGAGPTAGAAATPANIGDERSDATEGTCVSAQTKGGYSGEGKASDACTIGPMHAHGTNPNDNNSIATAGPARRVAGACSAAAACTPDERAVWITQRLQVRNTQNMLDVDVAACGELSDRGGGGGGGGGGSAAAGAVSGHPIKSRNGPGSTASTAATQGRSGRSTLDATVHSATSRKWHSKRNAAQTRGPRANAAGPNRAKRKTRVRAFDVRIEEYKEERRHAEEAKEARLQAWLAIKKRFRGLTLGTVIKVSGRLLTLMVYEFPDQPGNLNVVFTNPPSGATFRLSLGIGAVAAQARHVSVASSPDTWTLRQKRKVIKKVIQNNSKLMLVEEDETRDRAPERQDNRFRAFNDVRPFEPSHRPRPSHSEEGTDNGEEVDAEAFSMENDPWNGLSVSGDGISKHRACGVRQVFCAIRCLGRDSTAAYACELPTASRGFTRPRNAHQLQQPSPKDHRRTFSLVSFRSTHSASVGVADPIDHVSGTAMLGNPTSSHGVDGSADDSWKELKDDEGQGATRSRDVTERAETYGCGVRVRIRPRPRRECGRGRRLCGGIARVGGARGIYSLLRGDWAGAEDDYLLDWYQPSDFRPLRQGPIEAHTTFTLELLAQDLNLLTEGSHGFAAAEEWYSKRDVATTAFGGAPPTRDGANNSTGATTATTALSDNGLAGRGEEVRESAPSPGSAQAENHAEPKARNSDDIMPPLTESEAWKRVAREVLRKCYWGSDVQGGVAGDPTTVATRPDYDRTTSAPDQPSLEECIASQVTRTPPSGLMTETAVGQPGRPLARVDTADVRLVVGTCVFRRVIKVMGLGISPMYLLVVVSQWHDALVVRCYDFIGGEIRQAERLDRPRDSALISEFKNMEPREREIQFQIILDDLVVFDSAGAGTDAWSVKFHEDGAAAIIVDDAGKDLYDAQVEEQMAAAAAQASLFRVEKRREDTQKSQHAARKKDRHARARKEKRDAKRREAQAKSRKTEGATSKRGKKLHGGGRRGQSAEDDRDNSSDDDSNRSFDG